MKNYLKKYINLLFKYWMKFAHLLAFVNTKIILTILYFILVGPIWLVLRLLGKDYLDRSINGHATAWHIKDAIEHKLENAKHQF